MMLLTEINFAYCQDFMEDMRHAIAAGSFTDFCDAAKMATGDRLKLDELRTRRSRLFLKRRIVFGQSYKFPIR